MITLTLADLRYRARQFVIAILGVSLVLAMGLELAGLAAGFRVEVLTTIDGFGAHTWVLSTASNGAVGSYTGLDDSEEPAVAAEPGAGRVASVLFMAGQEVFVGAAERSSVLVGVRPGGLGAPTVAAGHGLAGAGQVVADTKLHLSVGQHVTISGRPFTVVGTVNGRTMFGGFGVLYMSLSDAQRVALGGRPLSSAIITSGTPKTLPHGLEASTPTQVVDATAARLASAQSSISSARWLMWVIAVFIVAALLYVSALDRQRDFAVLKALGASSWVLFGSLVLQAIVVTLVASLIAEATGSLLAPLFTQPVDTPLSAFLTLPVIAMVVGIVASLVALRKATGVDPASAFS